MPRENSTTGAVRTAPSSRSNRHSPYPSEPRLMSREEIPNEQPSSRTRRHAGGGSVRYFFSSFSGMLVSLLSTTFSSSVTVPRSRSFSGSRLTSIDAAASGSHSSTSRRDHTPSTEQSSSLLRAGISDTRRTRTGAIYLDPDNFVSVLDPWPDLVEWFQGPISHNSEQKQSESHSTPASAMSLMALHQLPIPAQQIPDEVIYTIFAVRDRDELVNKFNPICVQSLRESVRHHMYGRAFFSQTELNRGIRFLLRFLPSPDNDGMPRLDLRDRLSCRLHEFESGLVPLERPRYVRRLLFGRKCDVDDVVFMVSLCKEIREVAVTSTVFCRLLEPHSPVTPMLPENVEITILQDHKNPNKQARCLHAMCNAINVSHTESPAVMEAAAVAAAAAKAKAIAEERICVDIPVPRGTPLQRVKKLTFLTTPLLSSLPLDLFDHLSHLAVPINSFVTPDNVFMLCPRLTAAVFLFPWETQSSFQEYQDEILRQHVFDDRRVFAFVYDSHPLSRSRHPGEYERWKDGVREAFDFWERAHAYTVDCAKMVLESLEFNNMNKELVSKYLSRFDGNLAKEPLSRPGPHRPCMPMSLIRSVYVDPSVDDLSGIVLLIKSLPDVEMLALSSKLFDEVFLIGDTLRPLDLCQATIQLTILDQPSAYWPSFGPTSMMRRVTHLSFAKGISSKGITYGSFPGITHVAMPITSMDSAFVKGTQIWRLLRNIRAIVPRSMFETDNGPMNFISWAKIFRGKVSGPLHARISFHLEPVAREHLANVNGHMV